MSNKVTAVIVGDSGCGKTTLLHRFLNNTFPESDQLISPLDTETLCIHTKGQKIELAVSDVAGRELFDCLRQLSYGNADIVIICYSITDRKSLENVQQKWKPEVLQYASANVPILLLGTKAEQRDDHGLHYDDDVMEQVMLATDAGVNMQKTISAVDFMECSAKTGNNVREVFERATEAGLVYSKAKKRASCILS